MKHLRRKGQIKMPKDTWKTQKLMGTMKFSLYTQDIESMKDLKKEFPSKEIEFTKVIEDES